MFNKYKKMVEEQIKLNKVLATQVKRLEKKIKKLDKPKEEIAVEKSNVEAVKGNEYDKKIKEYSEMPNMVVLASSKDSTIFIPASEKKRIDEEWDKANQ